MAIGRGVSAACARAMQGSAARGAGRGLKGDGGAYSWGMWRAGRKGVRQQKRDHWKRGVGLLEKGRFLYCLENCFEASSNNVKFFHRFGFTFIILLSFIILEGIHADCVC